VGWGVGCRFGGARPLPQLSRPLPPRAGGLGVRLIRRTPRKYLFRIGNRPTADRRAVETGSSPAPRPFSGIVNFTLVPLRPMVVCRRPRSLSYFCHGDRSSSANHPDLPPRGHRVPTQGETIRLGDRGRHHSWRRCPDVQADIPVHGGCLQRRQRCIGVLAAEDKAHQSGR
jgi:hypothetical protein